MKGKSVSDLAFQAIKLLTEDIDKVEVIHIIVDNQARHTGDIQRLMKKDCGVPHYATQLILRDLVASNIIRRVHQGLYEPNMKMILSKMIEILEAEGEVK